MKLNCKNFKFPIFAIAGLFIFACASLPRGGSDIPLSQPDETSTPIPDTFSSGSVNESSTEVSASDGTIKNGDTVQISATPEIPPEDILLQIMIGGSGGPGDYSTPTPSVCSRDCIEYQNGLVILHHFEANQKVRVEIYHNDHAIQEAVFLKEVVVQTDQEGNFEFNLVNPDNYEFSFYLYDENGSKLPITCDSSDMSMFSTGQSVMSGQTDGIINQTLADISLGGYDRIPPDTPMIITGDPVCRQGVWWPVELANGKKAWALGRLLEPAK
ncbi:MAG: hypothetical protein U0Z26_12385 [Anaerolineales bacterium]